MGATTSCGCSEKCCGDEIKGQAGADMPGFPAAPGAAGAAAGPPGFQDLVPLPKQAMAMEPKAASAANAAGPKAEAAPLAPVIVERRWGKPARLGGLEIGFLLPDGTERHISFGSVAGWPGTKLGLEFFPTKPCTTKVVHPGGFGEKLGVQPGWKVQYVNGDRVEGEEVDYVFELMKRALAQAAATAAEEAQQRDM